MDDGSITRLLRDVQAGTPGAEDRLFDRVYAELHELARIRLAAERPSPADGGTDDVVHDAYARLAGEDFQNRRHLFFAYARTMRQILVDRARRNMAVKRGGGRKAIGEGTDRAVDRGPDGPGAIEVADLLGRLRAESEREAQVTELRYFGGLSDPDIAALLGISERTVRNDWARARERLAEGSRA